MGDPLDREPQGPWEEGIGPGASEKVEGLLREALGAAGLPETVDGVLQLVLGPREKRGIAREDDRVEILHAVTRAEIRRELVEPRRLVEIRAGCVGAV